MLSGNFRVVTQHVMLGKNVKVDLQLQGTISYQKDAKSKANG
jgi:hypothetical protein